MPIPKNRTISRLRLTVTQAPQPHGGAPNVDSVPFMPWPVASAVGGLVAGLSGWLLITGVALVSWFTAMAMPIPQVLRFSSQVWLLAHGGGAVIASTPISLVPLGLTLVCGVLCASTSAYAARQALLARTDPPGTAERGRLVLQVTALVSASYAGLAWVMALTASGSADVAAATTGAAVLAVLGSGVGACYGLGFPAIALLPGWGVRLVRGAAGGLLGLLLAGAVVLAVALILGGSRIQAIEQALGLEAAGSFVWSVTVLMYLPNLLIWAVSWALGAGFTVGSGSLVSLQGTHLGMLPAIPVLGALPTPGVADEAMVAWMAWGVVAGAVAGVAAVRGWLGRPRVVPSVVSSLAAALICALVAVVLAALSRGDLGRLRMVELGPRLTELVVIAVPVLGFSAALAGVVTCLLDRRQAPPRHRTPDPASETTIVEREATVLLAGSRGQASRRSGG